jgi:hypothetical protein
VEISLEASNQFQDCLLLHKWVQSISTTRVLLQHWLARTWTWTFAVGARTSLLLV